MSNFVGREDGGKEKILSGIESSSIAVVVATAGWTSKSSNLLTADDLKRLFSDLTKLTTDPSKLGLTMFLNCDDEEDADVAIDLNITEFPCVRIYQNGTALRSLSGNELSEDTLKLALSQVVDEARLTSQDDILQHVRKSYANTVNKKTDSCGTVKNCCGSVDSKMNEYSMEDLIMAGAADLGLGCGNPLSFAKVEQGMTLLDLGSGAGIDCFIAANKVGEEGRVIGVDMTPDMIVKARTLAKEKNYNNVQFRLGEIEYLPVADNSVDIIISNCVINLSPDKQQVCREMYRCLKAGGKIAVSDVVTRPNTIMPDHLKTAESLSCCVAGAPEVSGLETYLQVAGFSNVFVEIKEESREVIKQWLPGSGAENFVVSANIHATKPLHTNSSNECCNPLQQHQNERNSMSCLG